LGGLIQVRAMSVISLLSQTDYKYRLGL